MSDSEEFDSWSDEEDLYDSDAEAGTISCPECGCELHEDAEVCPSCGCFILDEEAGPLTGKPPWYLLLGLLGILATILALSGLF